MQKIKKMIIAVFLIAVLLIGVGIFIQFREGRKDSLFLAYDDVGFLNNHLYAVRMKNKIGYVNEQGKKVIEVKYDFQKDDKNLDNYQEQYGLIPFVQNNQFGLLDETGKVLIEAKYQSLKILSKNTLLVSLNDKRSIIKTDGKSLLEDYDSIEYVENSPFLIAMNNQKLFLLSKLGKIVKQDIESIYPITDFQTNKVYYIVRENNKFSLLKENENQIEMLPLSLEIPPSIFNNTIYTIQQNTTSLYDLSGNLVNTYPCMLLSPFKNGVTLYMENGNVGVFSDTRGRLTEPIYSNHVTTVNDNGYMFVSKMREDGTQAHAIVNPMGDKIVPFQDSRVIAMLGEKYVALLNLENEVDIKTLDLEPKKEYKSLEVLDDNLYLVSNKNGFGVIDQNLNIIIPLEYKEIRYQNRKFYIKVDKGYKIKNYEKE